MPSGDGGELFTGPAEDPTRYVVDREEVDRSAIGGEGIVYRARVRATGAPVALKLLTGVAPGGQAETERRAMIVAGVRHPNLMEQIEVFLGSPLVTTLANLGVDDFDVPYSVATWVEGQPLVDAAREASIDQRLAWVREIAAALHALHRHLTPETPQGVVHRDVKPSNIRIGEGGEAVLLDFGLTRPVVPGEMTEGAGTYQWRAPEVLAARGAGPASDSWALGAVAHWLLVGEPPLLDGSGPACERIRAALGNRHDGPIIAASVAELLHSSPDD